MPSVKLRATNLRWPPLSIVDVDGLASPSLGPGKI
jgi:hypothetical protein